MFEKLFKSPAALTRHRNAPYAEERERYLMHCAQEGYTRETLLLFAQELLCVASKLSIYPDLKVSSEQIEAAAKGWTERERRCGQTINTRWARNRFINVARSWLRFLGCLYKPITESTPFLELIKDFTDWLKHERGIALSTIDLWERCSKQFLSWYGTRRRPIHAVKISDIDSFLTAQGKKGWCRVTMSNCAVALRAFFRYAGIRGWCRPSIVEAIQSPRIFSQENLPLGPLWKDVKRLFASMETEQPSDIRDRAIIMFFAIYGLRASEVSNLCLEDIDWEHDRILVRRAKRRQPQIYPLVSSMGNAIAKYLKRVRPHSAHREVFLTLLPPFRPMTRKSLYYVVNKRMIKLNFQLPHQGPHSLRHACARHLVSQGFSLKEIGDHLGHRSSSATRIYAKVDLEGLREVAKLDLAGGLL